MKYTNIFTIKTITPIAICLLLTGCMGIGSKFDCDVDSGGKCAPMHQINKIANRSKGNTNIPTFIYDKKTAKGYFLNVPIRSNDKVQQIWIAPYEDANGNWHEQSNVYTVVKKSNWITK